MIYTLRRCGLSNHKSCRQSWKTYLLHKQASAEYTVCGFRAECGVESRIELTCWKKPRVLLCWCRVWVEGPLTCSHLLLHRKHVGRHAKLSSVLTSSCVWEVSWSSFEHPAVSEAERHLCGACFTLAIQALRQNFTQKGKLKPTIVDIVQILPFLSTQ